MVAVGVLGVMLALAGAGPALAAAGDLDPSFDGDGKVTTSMGTGAAGAAVAIQADDGIVVAGQVTMGGHYRFAVTRYLTGGTLDPTFGGDGKVSTVVGTNAGAEAVAIQSDGKIVTAGGADPHGFALVRYESDGILDDTFGGDGKVTTVIGDAGAAHANAVAIQSDGKIVAAGQTQVGSEDRFAVARYNTDGTLDDTFGDDGKVTTQLGIGIIEGKSVAIQTNGKIVTAGRSFVNGHYRFALIRYRTDGTLDPTFGGDGTVTTLIGDKASIANAVAIQPNGKIVVGGNKEGGAALAVARYLSDGTLDDTFSDDGEATTPLGSSPEANALALQDGKIVLAGYADFNHRPRFVLARFGPDGILDDSFSGNGKTTTKIGVGSLARGVAIQSDGRIVAAGFSGSLIAVARYLGP
jgi:uncharacterized delta-60 repeat protein